MRLAVLATLIAQLASPDPTTELLPFARPLLEAVLAGAWWQVAAILIAALQVATRWAPWPKLRELPIQAGLAFGLSAAGAVLNVIGAGASFTLDVMITALQIGFAAAGGTAIVTLLIRWWQKAPRTLVRINGVLRELPATLTLAELRAAAAIPPGHAVYLRGMGGEPDTLLTTDEPIALELGDELYSLPLAATGR